MNKRELISELAKDPTKARLERLRLTYAREHRRIPTNVEMLEACSARQRRVLGQVLKTKPVRSASGIAVVAVMTRAKTCPGKCIYCPQGPGAPKSYTGLEPAARRAKRLNYDPYRQTENRLESLRLAGNPTDKIELIVMGGTFSSRPRKVQERFVQRCFDALNTRPSRDLKHAQRLNESATHRCTGLCYETRPDECTERKIRLMRELGVTRVEIGVQSIYDDVLEGVDRGHKVQATIEATRRLKDAGLKVQYHIMPGLPGTSTERDLEMFRELFQSPAFRPDMLKIYPCLVIEGTGLYEQWLAGEYKPWSTQQLVSLLTKATQHFPRYLRIMRIQRDIPVEEIVAGVKKSNLGQLLDRALESRGLQCQCIRCREIGHLQLRGYAPKEFELKRLDYDASAGKEIFLSFEDGKAIAAFLRLRLPEQWTFEHLAGSALVRELRVFGVPLAIGQRAKEAYQHKGMGMRLLEEAEKIAKGHGLDISVTSAIGTREYYRRLGYRLRSGYMHKKL